MLKTNLATQKHIWKGPAKGLILQLAKKNNQYTTLAFVKKEQKIQGIWGEKNVKGLYSHGYFLKTLKKLSNNPHVAAQTAIFWLLLINLSFAQGQDAPEWSYLVELFDLWDQFSIWKTRLSAQVYRIMIMICHYSRNVRMRVTGLFFVIWTKNIIHTTLQRALSLLPWISFACGVNTIYQTQLFFSHCWELQCQPLTPVLFFLFIYVGGMSYLEHTWLSQR